MGLLSGTMRSGVADGQRVADRAGAVGQAQALGPGAEAEVDEGAARPEAEQDGLGHARRREREDYADGGVAGRAEVDRLVAGAAAVAERRPADDAAGDEAGDVVAQP